MRTFLKHMKKSEKGDALVLLTLAFGAMLTMTGLVIDGGHLFATKSHLQKTANAAALSGAQEIPNAESAVYGVVDEVLSSHGETDSLLQAAVQGDKELLVKLEREVPLFFAALFGQDSLPVSVQAKAALNPMGETSGVVPLGIEESMLPLNHGEEYELKVDSGDSESGFFGVLALVGSGANLYRDTLTNGYEENVKVGDIIPTQTGNMAGPTRSGVNARINNCPSGDMEDRNCSRVMLVVIYEPYEQSGNQLKSIRVTGFAYFYISEPMANNDDSIRGTFIKRTGSGTAGTGTPVDGGAYTIRLTE